jgi:hypothetical protein
MGNASYSEDINDKKPDGSKGRTIPYSKLFKDIGFSRLEAERNTAKSNKASNKAKPKGKDSKEMEAPRIQIEELKKKIDLYQEKLTNMNTRRIIYL